MRSSHHFRSSSFNPTLRSVQTFGTVEIPEGCVGHASSPGMSLFGAGFSFPGKALATQPVQYEYAPIFVVMQFAGVWSFHNKSVGCDATSLVPQIVMHHLKTQTIRRSTPSRPPTEFAHLSSPLRRPPK